MQILILICQTQELIIVYKIQFVDNNTMKKLVICASASFEKEIIEYKDKFEKLGYAVIKYPAKIKGDIVKWLQK